MTTPDRIKRLESDHMTPLHRTDPITAEALERMGFPVVPALPQFNFLRPDGLKIRNCGYRLQSTGYGEVTLHMHYLTTCSTLGELSDLCRCLGITLSEVPE